MNKQQAQAIIRETFENAFDKSVFTVFIKNLLNRIDESKAFHARGDVKEMYRNVIRTYERIGTFETPDNEKIDILVVYLQKGYSLDHARVTQRNFAGKYLVDRGEKDAGLFAFVSPDEEDWRFSLVKMDYKFEKTKTGKVKVKEEFTPARRWSFLVGANEKSHTAQSRLIKILMNDEQDPTLKKIEDAFDIETVTKEFFLKYRELFLRTKEELDWVVNKYPKIKADFEAKGVDTVNFTKKLLGQIVFLYFLQKKGWFGVGRDDDWGVGSKQFLRELFRKKHGDYINFFNDILEPLFYEALRIDRSHDDGYYSRFNCKIPFLNGGLFDPIGNYNWVHTDILLSNELFSNKNITREGDTGDGILDIFDRYNFTVKEDEPLEKEVAIDPELLGKAYEKFNAIRPDNYDEFKKALKSGRKGEENKFNKKFGVYYTPREIVHYMCQQSLINYLYTQINESAISYQQIGNNQTNMLGNKANKGQLNLTGEHLPNPKISRADIETLIHIGEHISENEARVISKGKETKTYFHKLPESIRNNASLIDEKLADITVCDPAVGSGAFPVGMMSEIVKIRNVLSKYIQDDTRTPYEFKRRCIEHSLYGVDIDPGAVEIAKLRLWLSLVVDEEDIKNIKPLPNLDYKIVRGNSLLGVEKDLFNNQLFVELERLKPLYFNETNPTKKREYKKQIDDLISRITSGHKEFDFEVYFSEVFHEKGGFDVTIGNPPYVRHERIKDQKPALKKAHPNVYQGTADLYVYFYDQGVKILRQDGFLAFITGNKFMRAGYGKMLRRFLTKETTLQTFIDFGDLPVFDATAYPCIVITQKASVSADNTVTALTVETMPQIEQITTVMAQHAWPMPQQKALTSDGWRLEPPKVLNLLDKLRKAGTPLGEYVKGRFYRGILTGYNEAFVINLATRDRLIAEHTSSAEIIKPFLRGRDVKRWASDFPGQYLIKIESSQNAQHPWSGKLKKEAEKIFAKTYPAIHAHFQQHRQRLIKRYDQGNYFWELRACAYWQEFEQPKIIYPNICKQNEFAWDDNCFYTNQKAFIIPRASKYLLGVLNSKVVFWLFGKLLAKLQHDYFEPSSIFMKDFPIPKLRYNTSLESRVKLIINTKQNYPSTNVSDLEHEIDQIVYQLYDLTPEEIEIVEGQRGGK